MKTMLELLQEAREGISEVVLKEDAQRLADEYFFGKSNRNTKRLFHKAKANAKRKNERTMQRCSN
jgi:hypothetical protein